MAARSFHRFKRGFASGELSPYLECRIEFDKMANGCRLLRNMACVPQGPAVRRPGFRFIYDLSRLGQDPDKKDVRLVPFIFNREDAYVLIFFYHDTGVPRMVIAHNKGGLLTYPDTPPTECPDGTPIDPPAVAGDILFVDLPDTLDIKEMDYAQSADEVYFAHWNTPQFMIVRYDIYCWTHEEIAFVNPPADWTENNYPETVTFHQQRLAYGGNKTKRQTIWMSEAGDFFNFDITDPDNVAGSVHFTLDSGTQNKIRWMISGQALFVGTQANEWTITGNNQSALTPSNILAQKQTNTGSEMIKPLMIGFASLYIERHGRAINEFSYDYNYDGYKSSDISILSSHLTVGRKIVDWSFQQVPHRIIWCSLDDGEAIAVTFQREQKVIGWHRHDTQGKILSVASIPGSTREDDLWLAVERTTYDTSGNELNRVYIELMSDWFEGDSAKDAYFLDSYGVYDDPDNPTDLISDLEFLNGLAVNILADGTVHPPVTVVNGQITLNNEYNHVVVGLPYVSEVRPYVTDMALRDGTTFGRVQRTTHLDIFTYKTLGGYLGRVDSEDGEEMEVLPFRKPYDATGSEVPLYTGVRHTNFPEGFDRRVDYFIRQLDPLPFTILGVIDTIGVFK